MEQALKNKDFISLKDASELCSYSQEYLSLLARRGLLRAKKIDNTWYTKNMWLKKYIEKKSADDKKEFAGQKILTAKQDQQRKGLKNFLLFISFSFLIFIIFLMINFLQINIPENKKEIIYSSNFEKTKMVAGASDQNYWKIFWTKVRDIGQEIFFPRVESGGDNFYELPTVNKQQSKIFENQNEGMVIVPSEVGTKNEVIKKIKNSFSDEVDVVPDGEEGSGLVVDTKKDDEYYYVMVPVSEE